MKRKSKNGSGTYAPPPATPLPTTSPLGGFLALEEYQLARSVIMPTLNSLRWFISENREELLEADALRQHRGRLLLHAERTDRLVDKIGRDAAARRFHGCGDVFQDSERA
jgi:hypothetical protein